MYNKFLVYLSVLEQVNVGSNSICMLEVEIGENIAQVPPIIILLYNFVVARGRTITMSSNIFRYYMIKMRTVYLALLCLASEIPTNVHCEFECMNRFMRIDGFESNSIRDYCKLLSIICSGIEIRGIKWYSESSIHVLSLDWIPPHVRTVAISDMWLQLPLHTKYLPKSLQFMEVSRCWLFGTLDTTRLPRKLVDFSVPGNVLLGNIVLSNLPKTLENINLQENLFKRVVFDTLLFPEEFQGLYLYSQSKYKMHVPEGITRQVQVKKVFFMLRSTAWENLTD